MMQNGQVQALAHDENEVMEATTFKYITMLLLLIITVVFALLPLWVSSYGTSYCRRVIQQKLPFITAGVFIGSGLLHLLPDATEMYEKAILRSDNPSPWMQRFPFMYLLCAVGCMIVWCVDLINLGDSGKMIAVASAARPNHETSMCRVQIPTLASFGSRDRALSEDGWKSAKISTRCSCDDPGSKGGVSGFHHGSSTENTSLLIGQDGAMIPAEEKVQNYSVDLDTVHHQYSGEQEHWYNTERRDSTVSEHVVFSGENVLLPYLLAALFSVHSLIAGFALGISHAVNKTAIATAFAIFSHKFIEAMSVGSNFAKARGNIEKSRSIAVLSLYSLMTPLGIFLGMILSSELQGPKAMYAESITLAIASGSFIYLAFHEMSDEHALQESSSIEKVTLFSIGLIAMAALATSS